jgi:hypothetical protein
MLQNTTTRRRWTPGALGPNAAAILLAAAALLGAAAAAADADDRTACVAVSTQAIFATDGYDHVVHLVNDCAEPVVCTVRTDVNPEPIKARIAPQANTDLVTWRGSPASAFVPQVECRVASPVAKSLGKHSH